TLAPEMHTGPCVLLVTGAPASGKSTLGRRLAKDLGLPYITKDLFKETLFDTLGWGDRAWSRRAGLASTQLLCRTAAALLEAGQSIAMESNFYPQWDTPALLELGVMYGCQFVQGRVQSRRPDALRAFRATRALWRTTPRPRRRPEP